MQFSTLSANTPHPLDLVPAEASAWSVTLRPGDAETIAERFPDIALPGELATAVARRQLHFAAGRHCARRAITGLGLEAPAAIGRDEHQVPVWPAGLTGSISHTDGLAWSVVAPAADLTAVGVDVERLIPSRRAARVLPIVCKPGELELDRGPLDEARLVTLAFSFKESLFKCVFPMTRRFFGYLDATITALDHQARSIEARLDVTLGQDFPAGTSISGRFAITATHAYTAVVLRGRVS